MGDHRLFFRSSSPTPLCVCSTFATSGGTAMMLSAATSSVDDPFSSRRLSTVRSFASLDSFRRITPLRA